MYLDVSGYRQKSSVGVPSRQLEIEEGKEKVTYDDDTVGSLSILEQLYNVPLFRLAGFGLLEGLDHIHQRV